MAHLVDGEPDPAHPAGTERTGYPVAPGNELAYARHTVTSGVQKGHPLSALLDRTARANRF